MRRAFALALSLLATPALAADAPLDGLLAFRNHRSCEPGASLARLMDSLFETRRRGDGDIFVLGIPKVPQAYSAQVGAPTMAEPEPRLYDVTLPLRGTWRGLRVRELTAFRVPESDFQSFAIRFDASPAQVRAVANRAGFGIPPSGERVEEHVVSLYVKVTAIPGGAELSCSTG